MNKPASPSRSLRFALFMLGAVLIYAYGFQVTNVNLDNIQSEERQTRLVRIIRALFQPDFVEYDREEFEVTLPIFVPCPEGATTAPEPAPSAGQPYLIVTPPCAEPRTEVTVEGFNFEPNTTGPLNFVPPSTVKLKMADIETDAEGHFVVTARLPNRPTEEMQTISAITRRNVGLPHLSQNGRETLNKIVETIFLALLATTLATALAVPISFLAARNLMRDITTSLTSAGLTILAWPAGILLGVAVASWLGNLSQVLAANLAGHIGGLVAGPLIMWGSARWALPQIETRPPGLGLRLARLAALVLAVLAGILALYLLAQATSVVGNRIQPALGPLAFLGEFVADLGDILGVLITPIAALVTGAILASLAGRLGQAINDRLPAAPRLALHYLFGVLGGAVLAALIGSAIGWLYEIGNTTFTLVIPAIAGALVGLWLAFRTRHGRPIGVGLTIYYVVRTILNTLRSIEALIVAVIMVVWVGLGPFAGALALALHSIAAGGKLYSEQVESIMAGPLEAIKATGATRLQTIIYAVIPQIIPPYISFTMYRWDINVRMSTIIGFVGGGGIGFLLQQNMNLLNYRGAAAQILAIAVVVATMDYISSRLRERAI
jgi:phosphonate ABC transporter permease subunit PhnE